MIRDNIEYIKDAIVDCLSDVGIIINEKTESDINLLEEGIDSITFIVFVVNLERKFNISIPDNFLTVDILYSLQGLAKLIEQLIEDKNNNM